MYADFNEVGTNYVSEMNNHGLDHLLKSESPISQMFSASTDEQVKTSILSTFTQPENSIQVIVATHVLILFWKGD